MGEARGSRASWTRLQEETQAPRSVLILYCHVIKVKLTFVFPANAKAQQPEGPRSENRSEVVCLFKQR